MQKTILLVEDNAAYAEVIQLHLEQTGHKIHIAHDGETALQSAGGIRPDIIFLDVMLPSMDGITVCAKLKGNPDLKAIPAVMLTGRTEMRAVNETLRAGVLALRTADSQLVSGKNVLTGGEAQVESSGSSFLGEILFSGEP